MNIWLLKDGEHLPIQTEYRKMRMGMLADALIEKGHQVTWWTSTFSHQRKQLLFNTDRTINVKPGLVLQLIYAGAYKNNISFRRYIHHTLLSFRFKNKSKLQNPPDIIITAFPIIDLAWEAVQYGKRRNIRTVVDIRDLWPDIFIEKSPVFLKKTVKILLTGFFHKTKRLFKQADYLVAVSDGYLKWGLRNAHRNQKKTDKVFYIGYPEKKNELCNSGKIEQLKHILTKQIIFTFIGSFGHSYELDLICETAKKLFLNGVHHIAFILAGDGEQYINLKNKYGKLPNLFLIGWCNEDELSCLLQLSHVGIVPCLHPFDSLPNKPFEYLSAHLPILSSLEGEMADIIFQNQIGYSYPCGDKERFYHLVMELAENEKLRQQMSQNAGIVFQKKFKESRIYNDYAEFIERVANQRGY